MAVHERTPVSAKGPSATLTALVQKCLEARGVGCAAWEQEIDERVAALYGL